MRVGIGDIVCDESGCYDDGTGGTIPTPPVTILNANQGDCIYGQAATGYCNPAPLPGIASGGGSQPSGSSGTIASLLASLTNAASGAVKAATTPAPYYITGPNGQSVLYNPATGTIGQSALTSLGGTSGGSSLMLLALAAVAIFALEKR